MIQPSRRFLLFALLAAPIAAQIAPDSLGPARTVARGVALRSGAAVDEAGRPQFVAVLDVDTAVPGVRLELALARGPGKTLEPTSLLARRGGATAAINGGFFTRECLPDGLYRVAGREVTPGRSARPAALVLDGPMPAIRHDPTGVFEGAKTARAAWPLLLAGGDLPAGRKWNVARHPRSAVGTTAAGKVLLMTVDGRNERAAGMTLEELAQTLLAFGCRDALNLDGGGSTALWVSRTPGNGIVNHPSDNKQFDQEGERAVADAVLVFAEPATDEPAVDAAERARRTDRDFPLTPQRLRAQLMRRVRDFRAEELEDWLERGLIDKQPANGGGFHGAAVSNLFFRDSDARARRLQGRTWSAPETETETKVFDLEFTLTVDADAVPAGETVRAWLPFPQEYEHQRVLRADHSAPPAPMRAVFLEQTAVAGKPVIFRTSYRIERRGVVAPEIDEERARLPTSRAFTELRAPHLVTSPDFAQFAHGIVGDETNPLRIARLLYDWCAENLGYSYAREYSTLVCIPGEVLRTRRGDCGQLTLLYMTLCRLHGIPARWQTGWVIRPGRQNLHDWCEICIEPWGWFPVDVNTAVETNHADGLSAAERQAILDFAFGNLDTYRLVVNRDHGRPLEPPKGSPRSDDVDFQRGEVEWGTPARNVYYDGFSYSLKVVEYRTR